jgi:3-(3-hydroxy-phenyl)propionate hydroxylase
MTKSEAPSGEGAPLYDVAIIGFGPVGASAALQLAEAGLRVAILDRSTEHVVLPRAVGLDGEAVRSYQRIGFADRVAALLQAPREGEQVVFTDSHRNILFGMPLPPEGLNGWRDIAFFDQPELEALLRELVSGREEIDVFLGHEVTSIEQTADDVGLRTTPAEGGEPSAGGKPLALRAEWVLGCDGASSFVRRTLGIEWQSLGYDQDWLVVDVVQSPEADLPRVLMQVCDPKRLTTYVCVKDPNRRWEFQLLEGETREEMERPESIHALLADWVPREHYEIRRAVVYQFHAATAERWRSGRIFLAGDAAHQTPPFLGQGLNAGLRDAANLAWKIPLVQAGVCDESLLDSYEAERDAHARDLVEWAVAIGQLMETLAAREAGLPDPHPSADQSAGYGQGRTAPPLRGGVLVEAQVESGRPVGVLLAQPTVRGPDGGAVMLDELLGSGFAVVARKESDLRIGDAGRAVLQRIGATAVSFEELEVTRGFMDRLFEDHPAVVVRPDRYVFGVVDEEWNLDRLLLELERKLALR